MSVAGKPKFSSVIEAMIQSKGNVAPNYLPTLHTDAGCILEALVAELSEEQVCAALNNQGLKGDAYRSTLRALAVIARERRPQRLASREMSVDQPN